MPVLHRTLASDAAKNAVVLDLGDLVAQGERLRAAARAEAERQIAQGRAERARLIATAADEGRAQGLAKGLEEGRSRGAAEAHSAALAEHRQRLDSLAALWTKALDTFEHDRTSLLDQARLDAVRLALELASAVVKRAIAADPSVVVDQAAAILATLARPSRLTLRVHPDDAAALAEAMPSLAQRFSHATHAEIATDPNLDRGSCIAVTPAGGLIDASVRAQLDALAAELLP